MSSHAHLVEKNTEWGKVRLIYYPVVANLVRLFYLNYTVPRTYRDQQVTQSALLRPGRLSHSALLCCVMGHCCFIHKTNIMAFPAGQVWGHKTRSFVSKTQVLSTYLKATGWTKPCPKVTSGGPVCDTLHWERDTKATLNVYISFKKYGQKSMFQHWNFREV